MYRPFFVPAFPLSKMKFVVAFNRNRDSYQVPLALYEAGLLERLVTDFYMPPFLARFALSRRSSHIPSSLVTGSASALKLQLWDLRRAQSTRERAGVFCKLDIGLSKKAWSVAQQTDAGLFLYSGYALEALKSAEQGPRRKILFVYHPQEAISGELLRRDFERFPGVEKSYRIHEAEAQVLDGDRLLEEISLADEIVCASSFTRRSLGNIVKPVSVVPYGCDVVEIPPDEPSKSSAALEFLFVGQGVQRKGLHHLLHVWARRGGDFGTLTVVSGQIDPYMEAMCRDNPRVKLIRGLSATALTKKYRTSDVFVMPSLVEGFGLVYLEALAHGCYVIGSENSGIPDIEAPEFVARAVPAGDIGELESTLERTVRLFRAGEVSRSAIATFARSRSWRAFRKAVVSIASQ
jgi:glycosyltransferase involved in cell wall biosynthesis